MQELQEDRESMQQRIDEQVQQIAQLTSLIDGLKFMSQDRPTVTREQVDIEVKQQKIRTREFRLYLLNLC